MKNILFLGDRKYYSDIAGSLTVYENYSIHFISLLKSAKNLIHSKNIDIAVVDIDFLNDSLDNVYQYFKYDNIPVIVITVRTDEKFLTELFGLGIADYIPKPVSYIEVSARLKNILKLRESENKLNSICEDLNSLFSLAFNVQRSFIGDWISIIKDILLTSVYLPAFGPSGDLFDYIEISDSRFLIYLGDISGHGIQASLLMPAIQAALKVELSNYDKKGLDVSILNYFNKAFSENFSKTNYMSCIIGILDLKLNKFEYFSAGHPPVITYNLKTGKAVINKEKGSFPLGMFPEFNYNNSEIDCIDLEKDTMMIIYSDGLFETQANDGSIMELSTLLNELNEFKPKSRVTFNSEFISHLKSRNYTFVDDLTFLCLSKLRRNNNSFMHILDPKINKVQSAVEQVSDFLTKQNIHTSKVFPSELVLSEILNNIIIHGYKNVFHSNKIFLNVFVEQNSFIYIRVLDEGIKFNTAEYIAHTKEDDFDSDNDVFKTSGRGLKIIKKLVDKISYSYFFDKNSTEFTIRLDKENDN